MPSGLALILPLMSVLMLVLTLVLLLVPASNVGGNGLEYGVSPVDAILTSSISLEFLPDLRPSFTGGEGGGDEDTAAVAASVAAGGETT